MNEIIKRSITEHAKALDGKEYSSEELTRAYLEQIKAKDRETNAFITVTKEYAIKNARLSDIRRKNNEILFWNSR